MSSSSLPDGNQGRDPLNWLEQERRRPGGSRTEFRRQLAQCDALLTAAGGMVADMIVPVTTAFLEADRHGAAKMIEVDVEVDRRCVELEETCYALLARQSPVAGDLRHVVAVLRSNLDVQ
ncbi:MAG: hypothetical protein M3N52_08030, partial [Actinomycetota bacterium]|nr:hypothetical protein [Actinomycetota bacterium]